jgi:hypothetical protein
MAPGRAIRPGQTPSWLLHLCKASSKSCSVAANPRLPPSAAPNRCLDQDAHHATLGPGDPRWGALAVSLPTSGSPAAPGIDQRKPSTPRGVAASRMTRTLMQARRHPAAPRARQVIPAPAPADRHRSSCQERQAPRDRPRVRLAEQASLRTAPTFETALLDESAPLVVVAAGTTIAPLLPHACRARGRYGAPRPDRVLAIEVKAGQRAHRTDARPPAQRGAEYRVCRRGGARRPAAWPRRHARLRGGAAHPGVWARAGLVAIRGGGLT